MHVLYPCQCSSLASDGFLYNSGCYSRVDPLYPKAFAFGMLMRYNMTYILHVSSMFVRIPNPVYMYFDIESNEIPVE